MCARATRGRALALLAKWTVGVIEDVCFGMPIFSSKWVI
jgi:hypothetical protein